MEELKAALPGLEREQYRDLEFGLSDALSYQEQIGEIYDPGKQIKEIKAELVRLRNNLINAQESSNPKLWQARLMNVIDQLPASVLKTLDIYDTKLKQARPTPLDSGFKILAMRLPDVDAFNVLMGALDALQADIITPGKGNARKQAKRHIPAIHCLAKWFKDALPGHAISADEKSLFYRYVEVYFNRYVDSVTPTRHIKNAIDDYQNWRHINL